MSCKPFKDSKKNSLSYLLTKGAIDTFKNIIDINKFRKGNLDLTNQARDKYSIDKGPLFSERTIMTNEKSYYQAVTNNEAFKAINKVINNPTTLFQIENNDVSYAVKAVDKVQSNISKINGWFKQMKDTDAFWKKVQSDLAIPKEQVELLRQSEGDTIEQKLVDFTIKYSYTVKIHTAKIDSKLPSQPHPLDGEKSFTVNGDKYSLISDVYFDEDGASNITKAYKNNNEISFEEYLKGKELAANQEINTSHYSNLTVPGGTNYTENEISTPLITPSIKGHAQFATDNGIGWFRSDDKIENIRERKFDSTEEFEGNITENDLTTGDKTTTRRILEVQSDIFQKSRDIKSAEDIYAEIKKSGELIVDCG